MINDHIKLNPCILSKEYDIVLDKPMQGMFTFQYCDKKWCEDVIKLAEWNNQWGTNRHASYPSTDILLEDLNERVFKDYKAHVNKFIRPMLIEKYRLNPDNNVLWYYEIFLAKYTPEAQSYLGAHHDATDLTLVHTLNDDFQGGGTYFIDQGMLLKGNTGDMSVHPGKYTHYHAARPVTEGTRYIIVTFINIETNKEKAIREMQNDR